MSIEELKKKIAILTEEWNSKDGRVTCEFSIHKDLVDEFTKLTKVEVNQGYWTWFECEHCQEYHGKNYVHVEIKSSRQFKKL